MEETKVNPPTPLKKQQVHFWAWHVKNLLEKN